VIDISIDLKVKILIGSTFNAVHLQAKYIQKQATLSAGNLIQKFVNIRLFVAMK
jgi:hypothetical protein